MTEAVSYLGRKGGTGFGLSAIGADVPCRAEALRMLSKPVGTGHPQAKRVSADALRQVERNSPFEDYPRAVYGWKRVFEGEEREEIGESYWRAVENFLRRTFHSLMFIPEILSTGFSSRSSWTMVGSSRQLRLKPRSISS